MPSELTPLTQHNALFLQRPGKLKNLLIIRPLIKITSQPFSHTKRIKRGIVVPEDFTLPPGYVRHYQSTDKGRMLEAMLMFHPDYQPRGAQGEPLPLPQREDDGLHRTRAGHRGDQLRRVVLLVAVAHRDDRDPRRAGGGAGLRLRDERAPDAGVAAPAAADEVEAAAHRAAAAVTGASADHGNTIQRSVSRHDQSGAKTVCGFV